MNRLFLFLIFMVLGETLFAQKRHKDFEIALPEYKIANSLYQTIDYIDSREDTTSLGIVQLGPFNRQTKVIPEIPLSKQLENIIAALTDSTAGNGSLLLQLRQFRLREVTRSMSESGYCYMRAALYSRERLRYQKIGWIDTMILISSMDVTNGLLRSSSQLITDFIAQNLLTAGTGSSFYSGSDLVKIDSVEKSFLPVYNADQYKDGLYMSFNAFKNQIPDKQITVKMNKRGHISSIKEAGENNKKVKIKSQDVYSIVYKGEPFIATEYGYYPLKKEGDDFYFTGKVKVSANTNDVIAASLMFGVIGGLIASNASAVWKMKIDHINGGFIPMPISEKQLKK